MDRGLIYPGQVPLETDLLFAQRASMVGLSKLAAALMGTATVANGLAVSQTTVPSMAVTVGAGELYQLANLDATAYSSIAADTTHQIVKQGVNLDSQNLAIAAPGTVGFSINYLIQAQVTEADTTSVVLPYYNASNPGTAYSGPGGLGTSQNTRRTCVVTLQAKAGTAATTGTQSTPAPDAGFVGLAVVTVANGAVTVVNGNISAYVGSPVIPSGGVFTAGLQQSASTIAAAGGSADALTGQYFPAITALTNGMTLYLRAGAANATTTPTFTPASGVIAAKTIVKGNNRAVAAGDIAGAGHWIELQYDLALDKWVLLNPARGVNYGASLGASGWRQLADGGYLQNFVVSVNASSTQTFTLPQSFPIAFDGVLVSCYGTTVAAGNNAFLGALPNGLSQVNVQNVYTASALSGQLWCIGR